MSNSNSVATKSTFSLTPQNLDQAMQLAEIMANSEMVPKVYQGKAGNVLIAVQMGADLGFSPTQALQSIAVINGNPAVWGDGMRALVMSAPDLEDMREWYDDKTKTAYCEIKRKLKGGKVATFQGSFSMEQAVNARLTDRQPWKQYPQRMQQWRAFGFAARDAFADRLKGIRLAEEVQDYPEEKHIGSDTIESRQVNPNELHKQITRKPTEDTTSREEAQPEVIQEQEVNDSDGINECYESIVQWLDTIDTIEALEQSGKVIGEEAAAGNLNETEVTQLRRKYSEVKRGLSQ